MDLYRQLEERKWRTDPFFQPEEYDPQRVLVRAWTTGVHPDTWDTTLIFARTECGQETT